ncbi:MAG: FAD-dependent oxidoreductase [Clostridiales bacterium]|nr:FAD-dependent oxidoreductase [Clostridiales bacterium]
MVELKKTANGIQVAERELPVMGFYDVVVIGGGVAGVAAGMAAGKRGMKTIILETFTALGGLTTLGLVNIPLDFVSGLGREMFDELEKVDGLWHRNTDPEKHKLVLDRMVKKYNCEVLFHSQVIDSIVEGDAIVGVVIQTKTGPKAIMAKQFIDASGDSDAAYYAGAETVCGRPGDGMSQGCSLEFILSGVDWDRYVTSPQKADDPKWLKAIRKGLENGTLPYEVDNHLNWITHLPGRPEHCGKDEVSICFAHSRNCYPVDTHDLTRMYFEGREQCNFLAKFIKENIDGFQNSWLSQTGALMGVRESRRIVGEYKLTASDIAHGRKFDDVVAISTHGYDIHNYEGPGNVKWAAMEVNGKTQYVICNAGGWGSTTPPPNGAPLVDVHGNASENAVFEPGVFYDIPYRALVPVKLDNLLAAGRNLSSDVEAQSGARLIMCCFAMGEAAGTAAALCVKKGIRPRDLNRVDLQRELVANGVNLGQHARSIPDVVEKGAVKADTMHLSTELWSTEKLEAQKAKGTRHLDANIPDPWAGKW